MMCVSHIYIIIMVMSMYIYMIQTWACVCAMWKHTKVQVVRCFLFGGVGWVFRGGGRGEGGGVFFVSLTALEEKIQSEMVRGE